MLLAGPARLQQVVKVCDFQGVLVGVSSVDDTSPGDARTLPAKLAIVLALDAIDPPAERSIVVRRRQHYQGTVLIARQ